MTDLLAPDCYADHDPRCTCGLVRRAIVPEEHDEYCPVVEHMFQAVDND